MSVGRILTAVLFFSLSVFGSGCVYTRYITDTKRSATEQLLLTVAIERALSRLELPDVAGKQVSLTVVSLAKPDETAFLESAAKLRLRQAGATIVDADTATLNLLLYAGTLGTISRSFTFGIPPVPIPDAAFAVPGLPILSSVKQRGYAKLRVVTTDAHGAFVAESAPSMQRSTFNVFSVFNYSRYTNDIYPPESQFERVEQTVSFD